MDDGLTLAGERGNVYLRSTAPGIVVASWYPREPDDPGWPGSIVAVSEEASFPRDAWEKQDESALREWIQAAHPTWLKHPT